MFACRRNDFSCAVVPPRYIPRSCIPCSAVDWINTSGMTTIRIIQSIGGIACIIVGILLFRFTTDSLFANLTPSEGSKYLVPMLSTSTYNQDILIHNKIISRMGIYVMNVHPLAGHVGTITLSLLRGNTELWSADVSSSSINTLTPSDPLEIALPRPVASAQDEVLRLQVRVSDSISSDIALRQRIPDNDFTGEGVEFFVDGAKQSAPIAYIAYERLYPALMKQVGGIAVLVGLLLITLPVVRSHRMLADHLAIICLAVLQSFSAGTIWYGVLVAVVACISWWLFRVVGRSRIASFFGIGIASCSTWLPLLFVAHPDQRLPLSIKDALLDPNQIAVSHGAGAYIGFFAAFFALVGIIVMLKSVFSDTRTRRIVDYGVFAVLIIASIFAFTLPVIAIPLATIPVALSIAWFAALGMDATQWFFGRKDIFTNTLLILLAMIALLDLMHVTSVVFAYGSGS